MEIAQKRKAQSVNNNRNKMIQCMSENLYVFTLCGGDYTISDLSYGIKKIRHLCRIAIAITAISRPIESDQTEIVIIETFVVPRAITGGFRSPRITTSSAIWRFFSRSRLEFRSLSVFGTREHKRI